MSALSDHVVLNIAVDSAGIPRAGFGAPMILSYSAAWVERTRTYGSLVDVADDFAVDTPEYLTAQAIFGQEVHPEQIVIGRGALKPTMRYLIAATAANSTLYRISVDGPGVTSTDCDVTSDASATVAEIHNSMVTALNAVTGKNYTAAFAALVFNDATYTANAGTDELTITAHGLSTGDGPFQTTNSGGALPTGLAAATNYWVVVTSANAFKVATSLANALAGTTIDITGAGTGTHTWSDVVSTARPSDPFTVTGNAAGNWFSLEVNDPALLASKLNHADPGVATDLAAIINESDEWYCLLTNFNSQALVTAAANAIQALKKIYVFDVPETLAITSAGGVGGSADTLDALATLNLTRTMGAYHPSPVSMMAAAWAGAVLPEDPGSETWKFKELSSVPTVRLTSTHKTNLRARNGNAYELVSSNNEMTWEGTSASGEFLDVIRGIDFIDDDMTKGVLGALKKSKKIPFTNAGLAVIESEIRAALKRAVALNILDGSVPFTVTVPRVADISDSDRALRRVTGIKFSARLAGAVHFVSLQGTVSA